MSRAGTLAWQKHSLGKLGRGLVALVAADIALVIYSWVAHTLETVVVGTALAIATLVAWYVRRAKLREDRDWLAHEDWGAPD